MKMILSSVILIVSGVFSVVLSGVRAQAETSSEAYRSGNITEAFALMKLEVGTNKTYSASHMHALLKQGLAMVEGESELSFSDLRGVVIDARDWHGVSEKMNGLLQVWSEELARYSERPGQRVVSKLWNGLRATPVKATFAENSRRMIGFRVMRAYAWKSWKERWFPSREWIFLAGASGFYYHNSGNTELATYIERCKVWSPLFPCRNLAHAKSLLYVGKAALAPRSSFVKEGK